MIKLIAADMDGTLLNENELVPEEFFEVFEELDRRGIKFTAASGRQKANQYKMLNPIVDRIGIIFENGSCGEFMGESFYKTEIDEYIVNSVIDIARKDKLNLVISTEDMAYLEGNNEEFNNTVIRFYENVSIIDDLKEIKEPVISMTIAKLDGTISALYESFQEKYKNDLSMTTSMNLWLHMLNKDADKGKAIKKLQEKLNISEEETMVFGDGLNDLELLKSAKYSFAMDNASDYVKNHANYVAPSNKENGVVKIIKQYILDKK
ncbi:HAD family hydrolase [Clostridium mediterraneense]|uniref:HAD family hydrolase n=1 Tax=Clostridium mediterraneense TaxID=1805472 RepID=UPI00082F452E|nr:HAD family hydrolase [Clostridium mediterraneense]